MRLDEKYRIKLTDEEVNQSRKTKLVFLIGYYQEKNSEYKYPLFVSSTKESYILYSDDTIYKYRRAEN